MMRDDDEMSATDDYLAANEDDAIAAIARFCRSGPAYLITQHMLNAIVGEIPDDRLDEIRQGFGNDPQIIPVNYIDTGAGIASQS